MTTEDQASERIARTAAPAAPGERHENPPNIAVGAYILGGVTVGHGSVIGANTVVVCDVPTHSTVFGVPGRPVDLKRRATAPSTEPFPEKPRSG